MLPILPISDLSRFPSFQHRDQNLRAPRLVDAEQRIEPTHELIERGETGAVTRACAQKKGWGVSVGLGEVNKRRVAGGFCVAGAQSFLDLPAVRGGFGFRRPRLRGRQP
jgi:hypothetical protein